MDNDAVSHFGKNFVGLDALPEDLRETAKGALARAKSAPGIEGGNNGDGEDLPFLPEYQSWQVGDVEYELRSPVIRQEKQLLTLMRESQKALGPIKIDGANVKASTKKAAEAMFSLDNLVTILGDGIAQIFAIILTPKGTAVQDKDLAAIATHLEDNLSLTQQAEVLRGFFGYAQYAGKLLGPQIESMVISITRSIRKGLSR